MIFLVHQFASAGSGASFYEDTGTNLNCDAMPAQSGVNSINYCTYARTLHIRRFGMGKTAMPCERSVVVPWR